MFYTYFLLFFIYSIIGWIMEVCLALYTEKKFINRGFLLGPYCPIYGSGCLLLTHFLSKWQNETIVLFALTFLICSLLEYITSWIMEKIFKLRWWDYTNMKFNINGRICLETMIPFSVIGILVIKYINPYFLQIINNTPTNTIILLNIILLSIIIIDFIISCNVIFNFKLATKNVRKDSTEEIKKSIRKLFSNNLILYDRIVNAFPNMRKIIAQTKDKTKKIIKKDKKCKK